MVVSAAYPPYSRGPQRLDAMKHRLRAEWPRALIALGLATGLWLVVSAEEATSAWVPVSMSLTLEPGVTLAEPAPPVRALVEGKRSALFKMFSEPPTMQRGVASALGDSAQLELRAQDVDLPSGSEVVVRDLRPRLLRVVLRQPASSNDSTIVP